VLARLDDVLQHPLTVVSAPAGSGKTVAVAQWCAERSPLPVTWLTGCSPEEIAAMAADLGTSGPRLLVLDGVGGADLAPAVATVVRALVAGSDVRVVVTTRHELGGDLAAARLDGAVDLVLERSLRFDASAMADLVRLVAGSTIRPNLAEALVDELEGWAAGAMLLALDWDPSCTVGNHRTVLAAGYRSCRALLASLVLEDLDPATRALVLDGARLPELAGDLSDRLAATHGSEQRLASLRSEGRFVVEVGADPPRYRFHRLARAALRDVEARDVERDSEQLREAADWYVERGLPVLAAGCFVELRDWDALAGLVFGNLFDLLTREQVADLVSLLTTIPASVLRERWSWTYGVAYLLMSLGELASSLSLIATVEPGSSPAQLVVSEVLRSSAVMFLEDPTPSLEAAERALELCDGLGDDATFPESLATSRPSQWRTQAQAAALAAGAFLGDWERVADHGDHLDPASALALPPAALARVRSQRAVAFALAGDLARADHEASAVLDVVVDERQRDEHFWAAAHLALGEVARLRCRAAEAAEHLAQGLERATTSGRTNLVALAVASDALRLVDQGQPDDALRLVIDHRRSTLHRPPPAIRGRLQAAELRARHRTGDASRTRDLLEVPVESAPAALAAAIVTTHLERGDLTTAERAVSAWPSDVTLASQVQRRLASAAIAELRGQRSTATLHLADALGIAAPHGVLQPFTELGIYVLRPLRTLTEDGTNEVRAHARAVSGRIDQSSGALALLTPRERLVLGHLASSASLPALAEQLVVSTNTIKTQVKAIYRKLGVASREEAVNVWRASGDAGR
jgi:LuxR family maltose regulon positive regulatory protein